MIMDASLLTRMTAGRPYPLGAVSDGLGVNFAVFSANATRVQVCVFDARGRKELRRFDLPECTDEIWHGYLPDAQPGWSTACAHTAPTTRATATASTLTSCCWTPTRAT